MTTSNFSIHHTLKEGNQSADFMAKLGAASDIDIVIHSSPPSDLMELLRTDAMGTYFPSVAFFSLFSLCFFCCCFCFAL